MKPLEQILFDDFLPSVTGHAKLLDKYHADIRSKWHLKVKKTTISIMMREQLIQIGSLNNATY
jgi:hypothetical protein